MKTKRVIAFIIIIAILLMSSSAFAAYLDVPNNAAYSDAAIRLVNLGIMTISSDGMFKPDEAVTREQFARIVVAASGLEEYAGALAGTSAFKDVSASGASSGYINAVVKKGYLGALADGKFHPNDKVTYAQVCTVLVRMLGYTDADIAGIWPTNYIERARALGITTGISLKSSSSVSRSTLAVMLDSLLDTNIKSAGGAEASKTFLDSVGLDSSANYLTYSKPEVVMNYDPGSSIIGGINLSGYPIYRNSVNNDSTPAVAKTGEAIGKEQIKDMDVVYQVTDKRNGNKYNLVVDNKITGEITGILPDKYSPKTLQIGSVSYEIGKYMDKTKLSGASGSYNVGDTVTVMLGYDGKVADVGTVMDQYNEDYALVLDNYSQVLTTEENYGTTVYYIKLLHADGTKKVYKFDQATTGYNGKLVKYKVTREAEDEDDYPTVSVQTLDYLSDSNWTIDRQNRKVNDNYVTGNVVIFNLVSLAYGSDANARILKWSEMPNGKIPADKIKYLNKVGDFGDINVMLVDNIMDEGKVQGLITGKSSKGMGITYTLSINGKSYTTTEDFSGLNIGSVVTVTLSNDKIETFNAVATVSTVGTKIDAIDTSRIKINGSIYRFADNYAIFMKDTDGNYVRKGTKDIDTTANYGYISVYFTKSPEYGGKASIVILSSFQ